jgi:hypothetical protein
MSFIRTLQSLKIAMLLGGGVGLGFGFGCVIVPLEECETGSNNKVDENGNCECRYGYEWCDQDSESGDLHCCDSDIGDDETAGDGDEDPTGDGDGDGDGDPTGDGDGDGDPTGDGDGDGDPGTLPPDDCSDAEEGLYWCTHDQAMGPEGSKFFICESGSWNEDAGFMDESCMFDGYDFAYGCVDDGEAVLFECGDGSGEACEDEDAAFCIDADQIAYCQSGKQTWDSCLEFCQEVGVDGILYEFGECDETEPVACFCCDAGDPGCNAP